MEVKAKHFSQLIKGLFFVALAGSLMGNQGCEQKPEALPLSGRQLKKRADLGQITASTMNLPGGGKFDFRFVANAQIYDVLVKSGQFAMTYEQPTAEAQLPVSINGRDAQKLKSWRLMPKVNSYAQYSDEASCMINIPQVRIGGTIRSFEAVGGGGVSIGFNPAGSFDVSMIPSASVMIEKAQLDLGLVAYSPLTKGLFSSIDVTSKQTKVDLNLSINFGNFSLGPKFYFQSPLSKVTKSGLEKAVKVIADDLQQVPWNTRVLADHDTHIAIMGGSNVGLREGDQLAIYNETHYWEGEPCKSKYLGGASNSKEPVAIIEVTELGEDIAQTRVLMQTDRNPKEGAKVVVHKLVEDPADSASKEASAIAKK
jgi:hypothetical protein